MIWIPGNVPSLKNSKVKTSKGIFSSKTVQKYIRGLGIQSFNSRLKLVKGYVDKNRPNQIENLRTQFEQMKVGKENPLFIGYHHVRSSKRKFDFSNSVEIIQDLLTAHNLIEDDNIEFLFPIPMSIDGDLPTTENLRTTNWYSIDPESPGVFIKIF